MKDRFNMEKWDFGKMKKKIEEIERLVLELKVLGKGMPVVNKNVRAILSFIYVLKFGILDIAETEGTWGEV
ncbi:MAG: hypothetical protein JRI46_10110 [Deltaproteobacteria bacterium]|nr:hypothetical protein [Deltaproteobacteria bacterium]